MSAVGSTQCRQRVDTCLSLRSKADARRNVRCRGAPPSQCGQLLPLATDLFGTLPFRGQRTVMQTTAREVWRSLHATPRLVLAHSCSRCPIGKRDNFGISGSVGDLEDSFPLEVWLPCGASSLIAAAKLPLASSKRTR